MGERGPQPTDKINWDEFDKLVSFQCTQQEIAAFFGVSVDTLDRACQRERGEKLAEVWNKKKFLGKVRLRKAQFEIVEKGGPGAATMAIYLDKKIFPDERIDLPPPPETKPTDNTSRQNEPPRSFAEFCVVAGYPNPFEKQVEMKEFGFNETDPRILMGARGYGKTDYITILGSAYEIYLDYFYFLNQEVGQNPNKLTETNLIISKSKARNTSMTEEVAKALTANGVPLEKENSSCVRVKGLVGKDHSFEAITIKTSFRGRHPKRIIMDDPVTEEDVSEAMRTLVKKKYDEALKLCKNICVIGQPAHAFDLYAELRPILKKLEVPHGTIHELDHDLEALILAGVDQSSIKMSYHLEIPKDGTTIFANVKYIDRLPEGPTVAFLDPSEGGDFTALAIGRGYFQGMAIHGKAWKRAWYHCVDDLVEVCRENNVKRIAFETNKFGNQPVEQLRKVFKEACLEIGVVGYYSTSNKEAVITAAGAYAHHIHLSKMSDKVFNNQVAMYEYKAKKDDAPDSVARLLEWLGLVKGEKK